VARRTGRRSAIRPPLADVAVHARRVSQRNGLEARGGPQTARFPVSILLSWLVHQCGKGVIEGRARVRRWKHLCVSDKFGLEAPIETRDASAWDAQKAVRQMQ
jgi:hypothetical protein